MQKITLDLPESSRRINLPADQWKTLKQWMEETDIAYVEIAPDETALKTDKETSIVYRITGNHRKVLDFLEH